jgi:CubicO group peptidase (beta-lactamase class C family)
MDIDTNKLDKRLHKLLNEKNIFDVAIRIESADNNLSWEGVAGSLKENGVFAIASITKMFTAAVIFNLIEVKLISLDETINHYLNPDILKGIHLYKGRDYGESITIRQLLCHTSGVADYYTEKSKSFRAYSEDVFEKDSEITFEEILERTRKLPPHFINGSGNKAFYSDLNYELLGEIAKKVTGDSLEKLYDEYIIKPLELNSSYLCTNTSSFAPIYWGDKKLILPLAASCQQASGGILSNNKDLMKFLRAFYQGNLFPRAYITNNSWKRLQWFPIEYSMGMMRCKMSKWMSPFIPAPEIIGHSGSTGSFAFYCPTKEIYIVGTINQIKKNPFPLIYLLLNCINFK